MAKGSKLHTSNLEMTENAHESKYMGKKPVLFNIFFGLILESTVTSQIGDTKVAFSLL